jgi:DNA-binding transcriptional LysR family regulator
MTRTQPGWELYRSFLAVVREQSLSGAGRALGLTQPTVGRHVGELEEALGVALFTRSPTGLRPTAGATALVPFAEAMESAADALARAATGEAHEERGAVRVTASEIIGSEVLPVILTAFRREHPQIDLELILSNRTQDLLRREADIAVRTFKPTQTALLTRKIGVLRIAPHAHPSYLRTHGAPRTLDELLAHPLIGFDKTPSVSQVPGLPIAVTRDLFAFRCDSDIGQYALLKAGFGIGFCQTAIGRRNGLLPVLRDVIRIDLGMWLVMHKDLKASRRVRLLFDHLARGLAAYVASQPA